MNALLLYAALTAPAAPPSPEAMAFLRDGPALAFLKSGPTCCVSTQAPCASTPRASAPRMSYSIVGYDGRLYPYSGGTTIPGAFQGPWRASGTVQGVPVRQ